ncbi:unnamed protein product [Polarella glacialis]|uniref:Fungal lipase-type domain-containing protein n=2 Tax=Polarella glacialis TaxID=89957 RepID=A0A813JMW0_POLGL|nr:unnamed protein product [Polarella glacialis]
MAAVSSSCWFGSPRVHLLLLCVTIRQAVSDYDESEALIHAYLATAAYCGYPKTSQASLEAWDCGPPCDNVPGMSDVRQILTSDDNDAYAFVGKRDGQCYVSFRGTSDLAGWLTDLESYNLAMLENMSGQGIPCSDYGSECRVGKGFMDNYNSISAFIRGNLTAIGCLPPMGVTVTGHSLGAAEAGIAMYDLFQRGYKIKPTFTFGQPRVGDQAWADAFARDLGANTSYRITYHKDPVVHLPFLHSQGNEEHHGFVHLSTEVFYIGTVAGGPEICDGSGEDPECSDRFKDFPLMLLACLWDVSKCDHLKYMTAVKTIPMDGSSCTDGGGRGGLVDIVV